MVEHTTVLLLKHYTLKRKPAQNAADVEKLAAEPQLPADGVQQEGIGSPARTIREDIGEVNDDKIASTAKGNATTGAAA